MTERLSQTQHWNPATYHQNLPHVRDFGQRVIKLLEPRAGERILDLGCGDGELTIKLVQN